MEELWQGLVKAVELIISLDREVMEIAGRSLTLAITSSIIASMICVPLASVIHFNNFRGKRILVNFIQTLYFIPTVAVGLFVFVFLSRAGPLGGLGLLFTPTAIVIGQVILISPIILGLTISALSGIDRTLIDTARSLGANGLQITVLILKEARFAVMAAVIMGFGRAISEVGISLMIGGNIRGFTRVITTAISLETSKGDIEFSLALGLILIIIALILNILLNRVQQR
ncbi:MAG: ABC transporter permease [Dehalococcoidales bacterium]|nr:ABC transporter permease [Dehalococcoidales bacterium]